MLVVVTPAKNEEKTFPLVARSLLNQTFRPNLWVVVDDNSTDKTPQIIKELEGKYTYIRGLFLKHKAKYDSVERYGYVVRRGFNYAAEVCRVVNLKYKYLAIVDADILLKENYFEVIINAFHEEPRLGIASGMYFENSGSKLNIVRDYDGMPAICGGAMVFRKECYQEIGGFPVMPRPDTIATIKAINRDWHVKVVSLTYAIHLRPYRLKTKLWQQFVKHGAVDYELNYHPVNALLTGLYMIKKTPSYLGLAYLFGYLKALLTKEKKVDDEEIRNYFWSSFYRRLYKTLHKC